MIANARRIANLFSCARGEQPPMGLNLAPRGAKLGVGDNLTAEQDFPMTRIRLACRVMRRRNADTTEYTWDLPVEWQEQDAYDFYAREVMTVRGCMAQRGLVVLCYVISVREPTCFSSMKMVRPIVLVDLPE